MVEISEAPGGGTLGPPGAPQADPADAPPPEGPRRVEVRPEDVLQVDTRPWVRLSLDGVVVRLMALSGLAIVALLVLAGGLGRLFGLW